MNGAGGYYPKQTNAGTENQMPHILTCKWELNDENYEHKEGTTDTGVYLTVEGGRRERSRKDNKWALGLITG